MIKLGKGINTIKIDSISDGARIDSIYLGIHPPLVVEPAKRIQASGFVSKSESLSVIKLLGYNDGVVALPFDTPSYDAINNAPYAEYEVALHPGVNDIEIRTLPTQHVYEGRDARFAVKVGNSDAQTFNIHTDDFSAPWR